MQCLFCKQDSSRSRSVEHIIPESLGNDDLVLPRGVVCDACNQYFGSKIESTVLQKAPFGVERVMQAVATKRGKSPLYRGKDIVLGSTGAHDRIGMLSVPPHRELRATRDKRLLLIPEWCDDDRLVRFLLKVGLEALVSTQRMDGLQPRFDAARECARYGRRAGEWDYAFGVHPHRSHLLLSSRVDGDEVYETHQIYEYSVGIMQSGHVSFCFVHRTSVFAVNLSAPTCTEYISGFNALNSFKLVSRWQSGP
jgi:hypothetical protein